MTQPCACRGCGAPLRTLFADLGRTPLANDYFPDAATARAAARYPLRVMVCDACALVQLDRTISPERLFADYAYFSSYSTSWLDHARRFAAAARERLALDQDDLIVEIASNDGYLLKFFRAMGLPVLGIEPAANIAARAQADGIDTLVRFFGHDLGRDLAADGRRARLVVGNNVLAHVPDPHDFLNGVACLLADDGVASFEFPHLERLVADCQFDTIYHEHVFYLSLTGLAPILAACGLAPLGVERLPTHGGSLRLWLSRAGAGLPQVGEAFDAALAAERASGVADPVRLAEFPKAITRCRDSFAGFLDAARGRRIAAYGAAAKGNTLLNVFGVGAERIALVADRSPAKQGSFLPGSAIPVVDPAALLAYRPDHVLILPWNLKDEIMAQLAELRGWGGDFVTPVPEIRHWR